MKQVNEPPKDSKKSKKQKQVQKELTTSSPPPPTATQVEEQSEVVTVPHHQGLINTNTDETCLDTKKPASCACPHFHQDGATDHPWISDDTHTMVLQLIVSHVAIWSSH